MCQLREVPRHLVLIVMRKTVHFFKSAVLINVWYFGMLGPRRVQTNTNRLLDLHSCDPFKKSSLINDKDRLFRACLHRLLENIGGAGAYSLLYRRSAERWGDEQRQDQQYLRGYIIFWMEFILDKDLLIYYFGNISRKVVHSLRDSSPPHALEPGWRTHYLSIIRNKLSFFCLH